MAQRYDSNSEDPGDVAQKMRDQEEIARQLGYAPPPAGDLSGEGGSAGPVRKGVGGALSGATTGASIGSVVPGIGTALGAGVGALVGGVGGMFAGRSNDTKNEREQFAQSLGQKDSTGLWDYLGQNLDSQASNELRDRALNRIGKHDEGANQQWMADVAAALQKGKTPVAAPVDAPVATPAAPVAQATMPSGGHVMGVDMGKFNDPNKHDFKYDTMRVLDRFDPRMGFTPEVIDALNKELSGTYGSFSGAGDKLSLTGAKGAKDAADFANQDWVYALKANNADTKWNFGGGGAAPSQAAPAGPSPADAAQMLSTSNGIVPGDTNFYNQLQAKLAEILGGPQALERDALLRRLTSN